MEIEQKELPAIKRFHIDRLSVDPIGIGRDCPPLKKNEKRVFPPDPRGRLAVAFLPGEMSCHEISCLQQSSFDRRRGLNADRVSKFVAIGA
ncbi:MULTISPECIES: hypothetical protein [unclassified Chelatococcus]|uniref:hypothetical protein n=1 Tax=unclassified Chelatococcus TaxID=2638111 RepID=UPI0020BDCCED|nr:MULTISPECIES: hypothetical protein [unclassified Chelatococcus]MCO5077249.1 hypothetical protein [Chelatococcus sp.]